jgi:hypothetical protein
LAACGDSAPEAEVIVRDASLSGSAPVVIGATANSVLWTATAGATTHLGGASLASLPAEAVPLTTTAGPIAAAGDFIVFSDSDVVSRVGLDAIARRVTRGTAEAVAGSTDEVPVIAWTAGAVVSWGSTDVQVTATLSKIDSCDHAVVTARAIYAACDGATGRRLFRIEQETAVVTPLASSTTFATDFPGGGMTGATYRGRLVAADDDSALWLVEERPSERAILVAEPAQGEPTVLLEHVMRASGFFASASALYWQEGNELLTAPRSGGPASIVTSLPGAAGAYADGYIYYVNGSAIERLRVE